MNYSNDFRSIRDDVSAQEWQTRIDLAACYRLVGIRRTAVRAVGHTSAS